MSYKHLRALIRPGNLEHSQGDYRSDNEKSTERAWDIVAELDFSKFWPEVLDSENEGLDLVFKIEGDTTYEKSNGEAHKNSDLDLFIGSVWENKAVAEQEIVCHQVAPRFTLTDNCNCVPVSP